MVVRKPGFLKKTHKKRFPFNKNYRKPFKKRGFMYWKRKRFKLRARFMLRRMPRYMWTKNWNRPNRRLDSRVGKSNLIVFDSGFRRLFSNFQVAEFIPIIFSQVSTMYLLKLKEILANKKSRYKLVWSLLNEKIRKQRHKERQERRWAKEAKKIYNVLGIYAYSALRYTQKSHFHRILRRMVLWAKTDRLKSTNRGNEFLFFRFFDLIQPAIKGFVPYTFRKERLNISKLVGISFLPTICRVYKNMLIVRSLSAKKVQTIKNVQKLKARFKVFYYKQRWIKKFTNFYIQNGKKRLAYSIFKKVSQSLNYFNSTRNILVSTRLFKLVFRLKLGFKMKKLWTRGVLQDYASLFKYVKNSSKPYIWAINLLNNYMLEEANKGTGNIKLQDKLSEGITSVMARKRLKNLPISKWVYNYGGDQFFWADAFKRFIRFSKKKRKRTFRTFR